MDRSKPAKRIGRPTKPPVEGERVPLGLRVTAEAKRKLEEAAIKSGRSISQEAELRIERSFDEDRIEDLRQGHANLPLDNGGGPGGNALQPGGQRGGGPMDDILIEELELGVRSYNCLKRAGIQTVGDLVSKSEGELAAIPNFGKKSIDEVIETLSQRGLTLRTD